MWSPNSSSCGRQLVTSTSILFCTLWAVQNYLSKSQKWFKTEAQQTQSSSRKSSKSAESGLPPSRSLEALRLKRAKYREKNRELLAEKSRVYMAKRRSRLKADPEAQGKYEVAAKNARRKYEASHQDFRAWRRKVVSLDRNYAAPNPQEEPRDYQFEWALYQEKAANELRERVVRARIAEEEEELRALRARVPNRRQS
ncbi:hypothetical protein R3P38DRAFT_2788581 [Favolaschia claudopus]|uniref:Uncharacterized protein n=1 Tax=Favolaschia claudopus TaxID=2862362 RepID=A0AAW0ALE1_9AGAR